MGIENDMPQSFVQALARDKNAMRRFAQLPAGERANLANRARSAASREELEELLSRI